jgi:hypothetical protein
MNTSKLLRIMFLLLIAIYIIDIIFVFTNDKEAYQMLGFHFERWSYVGIKLLILGIFGYGYYSIVNKDLKK